MEKPDTTSIELWKSTASELRGPSCRRFKASVVRTLGRGGQRWAEKVLGWSRGAIRKGEVELATGVDFEDGYKRCGRKSAEHHLPLLLDQIKEIVEPHTQTDPTFRSTRIYTPLSAGEVRRRLKSDYRYKESELPSERTIRNKMNQLKFTLKK